MFKKVRDFFRRGRSNKLEELLKENKDDFNFNLGIYFFPIVVATTLGCLFFNQAFWPACITIGIGCFSTLLKDIHSLDDKTAYDEFINICTRKEGIVLSVIMTAAYSILSIISIFLLKHTSDVLIYIYAIFNYEPDIVDEIIPFLIKPLLWAITITITSMAIYSVARLVFPLVIKKYQESHLN